MAKLDKKDDVASVFVTEAIDSHKAAPAPAVQQPSDVLRAQLRRGEQVARGPGAKV